MQPLDQAGQSPADALTRQAGDLCAVAVAAAMLAAAAVGPWPGPQGHRRDLYLWTPTFDPLGRTAIHGDARPASAAALARALRTCGVDAFSVTRGGASGAEVVLPSTPRDAAVVACVARRTRGSFNATIASPLGWREEGTGVAVIPGDG